MIRVEPFFDFLKRSSISKSLKEKEEKWILLFEQSLLKALASQIAKAVRRPEMRFDRARVGWVG